MAIRLDRVAFSTHHEPPRNYDTLSDDIVISGTILAQTTQTFTGTIAYTRGGTRADLYLTGNGVKILANNGIEVVQEIYVYSASANETVESTGIQYDSGSISLSITIFNPFAEAPITLVTQTITLSAVLYDMPITSI